MRRVTVGTGPSLNLDDNGNVELRIVLLDIACAVFGAEFLDYGCDLPRVSDRNGFDLGLFVARTDPHRGVRENVLVPLGVRALHGQEVKVIVIQGIVRR
jgi:hypothetical protein